MRIAHSPLNDVLLSVMDPAERSLGEISHFLPMKFHNWEARRTNEFVNDPPPNSKPQLVGGEGWGGSRRL